MQFMKPAEKWDYRSKWKP